MVEDFDLIYVTNSHTTFQDVHRETVHKELMENYTFPQVQQIRRHKIYTRSVFCG